MLLPIPLAVRKFPWAAKQAWKGVWADEVGLYAAAISFHTLTSSFALIFLSTSILAILGGDVSVLDRLIHFLEDFVPPQFINLLEMAQSVADRPVSQALLPVAFVVTLWMGTNIFGAVIHALNAIYHVDEMRSYWRTRAFALAYVTVGLFFLLLSFLLFTVGGFVDRLPPELDTVRGGLLEFVLSNRELISVVVLATGAVLIYWLAPNFRAGPRIVIPGAVWFTITFFLGTAVFNAYLNHLAVYDRIYGPLATVVVTLTWVNLACWLLLVGGEINAAYYRLLVEEKSD